MAEETTTENAQAEAPADADTPAAPADLEAPAELTAADLAGWAGFKLDEMGGASVGKVEGVYVDDKSGRPEWILARMGRFGAHCLVPARDAVTANGRAWVPYTRDQIRRAPRVQPGKPLERESEQKMLDHYGIGKAATGRSAELAEREAGTKTVHPADS